MRREETGARLVALVEAKGYRIAGHETAYVERDLGQAMMNKAAGEMAWTWELLVDPLVRSSSGRIVARGMTPVVTMPDGTKRPRRIGSHMPVAHILATAPADVSIDEHDLFDGLHIDTADLPDSWKLP